MDHKTIKNLNLVINKLNLIERKTKIIAVSKTFEMDSIIPLINHGHIDYGENKIQEATKKWTTIKSDYKNIKLHLIGKLQSNKVKYILPLFDYIHSLDSLKLAKKISLEQNKKKFRPKIFVQVNIGRETQKNGIDVDNLENFLNACKEFKLDIIGLMCIPPNDQNTQKYFTEMQNLNIKFGFNELSMGMSADYELAVKHGATFVRIGSSIFGSRST